MTEEKQKTLEETVEELIAYEVKKIRKRYKNIDMGDVYDIARQNIMVHYAVVQSHLLNATFDKINELNAMFKKWLVEQIKENAEKRVDEQVKETAPPGN